MLKILQARLQQCVNCEFPDVQAGFTKGRGTRDQIANIHWIIKKAREFQKTIYFCFIDYAKAFDCVDHNKLENSSRDGNTRPLTCLLRNLYAGQEATVRTRHGTMEQQTGSKLGKEYVKVVYCHPAYLTSMQSTSSKMLGWMKHKLETWLLGEISVTSDMQMIPPSWHKAKRNYRAFWWRWKRRVKKVAELNIQKTNIMASGPITSWEIDEEKVDTVTDFIFLVFKITADGDYSHEIKRCLLLGRKAMAN